MFPRFFVPRGCSGIDCCSLGDALVMEASIATADKSSVDGRSTS